MHHHSQREERKGSIVRKYKARWKTSSSDLKLCISMPDDNMLFSTLNPFIFADCNMLLSLHLLLCPFLSSPWQLFHDSGISKILESALKFRLYLQSFTLGPLWASMQQHPWHTPGLSSFMKPRREIPQPFLISLILKPNHMAKAEKVFCLCWGWNMAHSFKHIFISFLVLIVSLIVYTFLEFLLTSWELSCLGSLPEVTPPFIPFRIRLFFIIIIICCCLNLIEHWAFSITLPGAPFLLKLLIFYFPLLILFLFVTDLHKRDH